MAAQYLALDSFWVDKSKYDDAERAYYESQRNESLTPLADEVARARQRLNEIRGNFADGISCNKAPDQCTKNVEPEVKAVTAEAPSIVQPAKTGEPGCSMASVDVGAIKFLEKKITDFEKVIDDIQKQFSLVVTRLSNIEAALPNVCPAKSGACQKPAAAVCQKPAAAPAKQEDDDDDVDLFGSESEDEEAVTKLKEERLAAYNAKKSKKPALIAKSSIILDVKPWDDETDMKLLEAGVRKIEMDGLLWGASKLVPLAYGIHKLQINCVVEDEKVSVDLLQEQIEAIEDFVQSVDIAAFNKI